MTISEENGQAIVHIDSEGVPFGDYELKLESFDAMSTTQTTLKTDTILVSVKLPQTFESQSISAVEPASWVLGLNFKQENQV